jgi:hypothetical protein
VQSDWIETEATIASIYKNPGPDGETYSVVFTYKVGDSYFGGTFTPMDGRHYVGENIPVWYDPADPGRNNLVKREKLMKWVYAALAIALGLYFIYLALHSQTR